MFAPVNVLIRLFSLATEHCFINLYPLHFMIRYLNSPLKVTGVLLMLSGVGIVVLTFAELLFLGISVFLFGILIQITADLLLRSTLRHSYKRTFELALLFFIVSFCGILLLDYMGIIKIAL